MYSTSEREPSSGENSTSSVYSRACATAARAWPLTSSRVVCSLRSMWMSLVAMNVWMRGRSESLHRVPGGLDVLAWLVRARPQITGPFDLARDRLHRLEVARRGDREAGLDDVHAEPRELLGDLELFLRVQRDARATARRRAASCRRSGRGLRPGPLAVRHCRSVRHACHVVRAPSLSRLRFLSAGFAATRPPRAIPPEGGAGEAEERGSKRHA